MNVNSGSTTSVCSNSKSENLLVDVVLHQQPRPRFCINSLNHRDKGDVNTVEPAFGAEAGRISAEVLFPGHPISVGLDGFVSLKADRVQPLVTIKVKKTGLTARIERDRFRALKRPPVFGKIADEHAADHKVKMAILIQVDRPARRPSVGRNRTGLFETGQVAGVVTAGIEIECRVAGLTAGRHQIEQTVLVEIGEVGRDIDAGKELPIDPVVRRTVPESAQVAEEQLVAGRGMGNHSAPRSPGRRA